MQMIIDRPRIPMRHLLTIGLLPSPLKVAYYRWRGARIGRGVRISLGAVIIADEVEIGDGTTISMGCSITCARLKIGKRTRIRSLVLIDAREVSIGDDVIISEVALIHSLIPGKASALVLHDRAHVFPFTVIDTSLKVEIGEESCLGHGSSIYTHSSYKSKLDGYPVEFGEVTVGKGVWLSSNVFINPSVTIGDNAVVATGTVVSRDVPSDALVMSAPARVLKSRELYAAPRSEQDQLTMLTGILDGFCQYLEDFAGYTWQRSGGATEWCWELASSENPRHLHLTLSCGVPSATDASACVMLDAVPEDVRTRWNDEKRTWFSIGSHACSESLDSLGEELREYFKRYGIYFARP
jgi:acetyltransferase-like isoleucine patch superfamily enzyme